MVTDRSVSDKRLILLARIEYIREEYSLQFTSEELIYLFFFFFWGGGGGGEGGQIT